MDKLELKKIGKDACEHINRNHYYSCRLAGKRVQLVCKYKVCLFGNRIKFHFVAKPYGTSCFTTIVDVDKLKREPNYYMLQTYQLVASRVECAYNLKINEY